MKTDQKSEYELQAEKFLNDTKTTFKAEFLKHDKHFEKDDDTRDIYKITLTRGNRSYAFNFGQSLVESMKYKDTLNGNEYTPSGRGLNCNMKIVGNRFFKNHCKEIKGTPPDAYSVLAGLQKYDVGTFENFCAEFGYDEDSRTAEKVYKAVCDEYLNLCALFSETELEQLQEIQ